MAHGARSTEVVRGPLVGAFPLVAVLACAAALAAWWSGTHGAPNQAAAPQSGATASIDALPARLPIGLRSMVAAVPATGVAAAGPAAWVKLPDHLDGEVRLGAERTSAGPGFRMLGAPHVARADVPGGALYVAPDWEVLQLVRRDVLREYVAVHRHAGRQTWRWELDGAGSMQPRLRPDGRVELGAGSVIQPPALFSATMEQLPRDVAWRLDGRILSLTFDDTGLALPYVIDPDVTPPGAPTLSLAAVTKGTHGEWQYWPGGASTTLFVSGAPGTYGSFDLTLAAAAGDYPVDHVQFPGAVAAGWTPSADSSIAAPGPYTVTYAWGDGAAEVGTVQARAVDTAGVASSPLGITIQRDADPPTGGGIVAGPLDTWSNNTSPAVAFAPQVDAASGIAQHELLRRESTTLTSGECDTVNWGGWMPVGSPNQASPLVEAGLIDGRCYQWALRAQDNVGNARLAPETYSYRVDTVQPSGSMSSTPPPGATWKGQVDVAGSSGDDRSGVQRVVVRYTGAASGVLCIDATPQPSWSCNAVDIGALPDGSYVLHLDVEDRAGNVTTDAATLGAVIDNTGPADIELAPAGVVSVAEGGAGGTYQVRLASRPTSDVTIDFGVGTQVQAIASITFTPSTWHTFQAVFVGAVDDRIDEAATHAASISHTLRSADPAYAWLGVASQAVAIADDDTAGVTANDGDGLRVAEAGATSDTYTLVLDSEPVMPVAISSIGDGQVGLSAPVTFTAADWNVPQAVTVTAVDDAIDETDPHGAQVGHVARSQDPAYDAMNVGDRRVDVADDDTAALVVAPVSGLVVEEAGQTSDRFTVRLASEPVADVTVTTTTPDEQMRATSSLTFSASNWNAPQVVTVTAVDDAIAEASPHPAHVGTSATSFDPRYDRLAGSDVVAGVVDNDAAGVVVAESLGSTDVVEGGASDTYSIVLTSQPVSDVGIQVSGDADVAASPSLMVFSAADWYIPQVVTVTGTPDSLQEGMHTGRITHLVSSSDAGYDARGVRDVVANVTDAPVGGISISPAGPVALAEGGSGAQYRVQLTDQPAAPVTVGVLPDPQLSTDVASLTFTPADWNVAKVVSVSAANDRVVGPSPRPARVSHTISSTDRRYDAAPGTDVAIQVTDDDRAGATIAPTAVEVTEGAGSSAFTVVLDNAPRMDVVVSFGGSGQLASMPPLTFTPATWNVPRSVQVSAVDDLVAEADPIVEQVTIDTTSADPAWTASAAVIPPLSVTVHDNDVAGFVRIPAGDLAAGEGSGTQYSIALTSAPTSNVVVRLAGDAQVAPAIGEVTFTPTDWATPRSIAVAVVQDLVAEGPHEGFIAHQVVTSDPRYAAAPIARQRVAITDDDTALVVLDPQGPLSIAEGGTPRSYRIHLNSQPTSTVTVAVQPGDMQATVQPSSLQFTTSNWSVGQLVAVTAVDDDVDEAAVHGGLVLHTANGNDAAYASLMVDDMQLAITDNDDAAVVLLASPPNTDVTEGGATDQLNVRLGSRPASDVTVTLFGSGVTVGSPLTFTPQDWDQLQQVTITSIDDDVDQGATYTGYVDARAASGDPGYRGLAAARVPVEITDNDVAGVSITHAGARLLVAEDGSAIDGYDVVLRSAPTTPVTIDIVADPAQLVTSVSSLTFSQANWNAPRHVGVLAYDDNVPEAAVHGSAIRHVASSADAYYDGAPVDEVGVDIEDDDTVGIVVTDDGSVDLDEAGTLQERYTIRLLGRPTAPVTIATTTSQVGVISPSSIRLDQSNWKAGVEVRIQGLDDAISEANPHLGRISHTASSLDARYNRLTVRDVEAQVADDDPSGLRCYQGSVYTLTSGGSLQLEESPTGADHVATCSLTLQSTPSRDVTVSIDAFPVGQVQVSPASVTFRAGQQPQSVPITFTAVDDRVAEGVHAAIIHFDTITSDPVLASARVPDQPVEIVDDDRAGVIVAPSTPTKVAEGGAGGSYTIKLASQPTRDVVVTPSPDSQVLASPGTAGITFTPATWNVARTVSVSAIDDPVVEASPHDGVVAHAVVSADPMYNQLDAAPAQVSIKDNDVARVVVTQSGGSTQVSEDGTGDALTVTLGSRPSADVTVTPSASDGLVLDPAGPLTFTPATWNVGQVVTVVAVQDPVVEGTQFGAVSMVVASRDTGYDGGAVNPPALRVTVLDDDIGSVRVTESNAGTDVAEGGAGDTYALVLGARPLGDVTVTADGGAQIATKPSKVTFTPDNWSNPQEVSVQAVDDPRDELDPHTGTILHAIATDAPGWDEVSVAAIRASISDNDSSAVVLRQTDDSTAVGEAGGDDTVTLRLRTQPQGDVKVNLAPDAQVAADTDFVAFTPRTWNEPQKVTISAIDDLDVEGAHVGAVEFSVESPDAAYAQFHPAKLVVKVADDDHAASEGGGGGDGGGSTGGDGGGSSSNGAGAGASGGDGAGNGGGSGSSGGSTASGHDGSGSASGSGGAADSEGTGATREPTRIRSGSGGRAKDVKPVPATPTTLGDSEEAAHREQVDTGPTVVDRVHRWIRRNLPWLAPVSGMATFALGTLGYMLRSDPVRSAARTATAARAAGSAASRGARAAKGAKDSRNVRVRAKKRKRRKEDDDPPPRKPAGRR